MRLLELQSQVVVLVAVVLALLQCAKHRDLITIAIGSTIDAYTISIELRIAH